MVEHRMNSIVQHQLYSFLKVFERCLNDLLILRWLTVSNPTRKTNHSFDIQSLFFVLHQEHLDEHDKLLIDIPQCLLHHLNKPNEEQFDHPWESINEILIRRKSNDLLDLSSSHNRDHWQSLLWLVRIFYHMLNNKSLNSRYSYPLKSKIEWNEKFVHFYSNYFESNPRKHSKAIDVEMICSLRSSKLSEE